jgi:hypothetical protein
MSRFSIKMNIDPNCVQISFSPLFIDYIINLQFAATAVAKCTKMHLFVKIRLDNGFTHHKVHFNTLYG